MGFACGFQKTAAAKPTEHRKAGLIALTAGPQASSMYSAMKSPGDGSIKSYAKARAATAAGTTLGTVAGLGAGILTGATAVKLRGKGKGPWINAPKSWNRILGEKKNSTVRTPAVFLIPVAGGTLLGRNLGMYLGAKKGHTLSTGKKE